MLSKHAGNWSSGELRSTLAQELMHCVNVWHHGETDETVVWRPDTISPGGGLVENGYPIKLLLESGYDMTPALARFLTDNSLEYIKPKKGVPQGQHSRFDNCVMRYDDSTLYQSTADSSVRYYVREEPVFALCKSGAGTGVNANGRRPQSRYSETAAARGNCAGQILVNDAATAPAR